MCESAPFSLPPQSYDSSRRRPSVDSERILSDTCSSPIQKADRRRLATARHHARIGIRIFWQHHPEYWCALGRQVRKRGRRLRLSRSHRGRARVAPRNGPDIGRQSKPFSHFMYRSDPPVRTEQFKDPLDHSTLIELRGLSSDGDVGLQTIVPPSTHVSGEAIRFENGFDGTPANVDADVVLSAVRRVAAVALFARRWPGKGSRHHAFLALAGCLPAAIGAWRMLKPSIERSTDVFGRLILT